MSVRPLFILLLATSCAHTGPREEVRLTYDKRLERAGTPTPTFVADVGGEQMVLMVDTAAPTHALAGQAREVSTSVDGMSFGILRFNASTQPEEWDKNGIQGVFVPQLAGDGAWTVDFREALLRKGSLARWANDYDVPSDAVPAVKYCAHIPAVEAVVDGRPARLLVDSGAEHTMLVGLLEDSIRPKHRVVVGGRAFNRRLRQQGPLPPGCVVDGSLGMDILKRCVLFLSRGRTILHCN